MIKYYVMVLKSLTKKIQIHSNYIQNSKYFHIFYSFKLVKIICHMRKGVERTKKNTEISVNNQSRQKPKGKHHQNVRHQS